MSAVDAQQRLVRHRLDAILDRKEAMALQSLKIVEQGGIDTVGSCADDQAHHAILRESLLVATAQHVKWGVGVGECLKVGQILHVGIFMCEKLLALANLLCNGLLWLTVGRVERAVIAESASPVRHLAVAVGTGEARVDRNLLHAERKLASEPRTVIVIERFVHC